MFPRYETDLDYKKFDIYVTGKLKTCFQDLSKIQLIYTKIRLMFLFEVTDF